MQPVLITVREAAKLLGLEKNLQRVREMIKAGVPWAIPTNKTGRKFHYDIFRERLELWIAGKDLQA